ncbi:MAG: ExeA family protein [Candidatus Glassbacteria bacterium]
MYRSFYGIDRRPFDNVPDPAFYFETSNMKEAYECLRFSIHQEGVISLLTGRDGCGKTLLLRMLMKEVDDSYELACMSGSLNTAEGFLSEILYQLQGSESAGSRDSLLREIGDYLLQAVSSGRKSLIVFDGVSGIARDDIQLELRRLLDLQLDDRALAAFIIAGDADIESVLSGSMVGERMSVVARVKPLSLLESISYIDHRLKVAGASADLFTSEAKAALGAAACGVPGQINILADLSLFCGFRTSVKPVDLKAVDMALSRSLSDEIQGPAEKAQGTNSG